MTPTRIEDVFAVLLEVDPAEPKGLRDLSEGTAEGLARKAGMSDMTSKRNLLKLKAQGRAHIHTWTDSHPRAAVWVRGPGEDAPKPARMSREEHNRVSRERMRRLAAERASMADQRDGYFKDQTMLHIEWARRHPQTWFAALLGAQSIQPMKEAA